MAKIYSKPTIEWYKKQVGYSSGSSKSSKYSKTLDSVSFYNTKKNGYADWCAIFYDAGIYENAEPNSDISGVRALVYEPNSDNCGAGCAQKIQYYKNAGAWYPHKAKGCPAMTGDEIFFGAEKYKSKTNPLGAYHTGAVIDWDSNGLYTAEGNTNGKGDVSKKFYSYSDSRILGYGRPNWTGSEPPKEEKPEPAPEPTPAPAPTPEKPAASSGKKYKVIAKRGLNIRSGTGKEYRKLGALNYGDTVTVYEIKNGWGRIGDGRWVCMDYLK